MPAFLSASSAWEMMALRRDEGKNIFLEGSRPIECSLIQRDERFLAFFLGFPKNGFPHSVRKKKTLTCWQRSRGRSYCRAFPLRSVYSIRRRRSFAAVMTCCLFRAQLS